MFSDPKLVLFVSLVISQTTATTRMTLTKARNTMRVSQIQVNYIYMLCLFVSLFFFSKKMMFLLYKQRPKKY